MDETRDRERAKVNPAAKSLWLRQMSSDNPRAATGRKSTVCGLNGLRPLSASLGVPFKPSPVSASSRLLRLLPLSVLTSTS
jgi:hypothetical protein